MPAVTVFPEGLCPREIYTFRRRSPKAIYLISRPSRWICLLNTVGKNIKQQQTLTKMCTTVYDGIGQYRHELWNYRHKIPVNFKYRHEIPVNCRYRHEIPGYSSRFTQDLEWFCPGTLRPSWNTGIVMKNQDVYPGFSRTLSKFTPVM